MNLDARHAAISDCKYAKSLGSTALMQHIAIWDIILDPSIPTGYTEEEYLFDSQYQNVIIEIKNKLGTPECLLEN